MITSSSISYISQMLEEPQNIHDADSESINTLTNTYPYFVPARYMQAARQHKLQPYSPEMMAKMQLFSGNWYQYCEYLQDTMGGEVLEYNPSGEQSVKRSAAPTTIIEDEFEDIEQEVAEIITEAAIIESKAEPIAMPVTVVNEVIDEVEPLEYFSSNVNTGFIRGRQALKETQPEEVKPVKQERQAALKTINTEFKRRPEWEHQSDNLIPPIYTEDYFLHQGMNVSNDIPEDIGKPDYTSEATESAKSLMVMMSFSEWLSYYKKKRQAEQEEEQDQKELKTMWQKEKLAAAMEEENEEIPEGVFEMAVNSITKEENLISESLADVLVKQGRHDKAIDMYKKLSLRKPQKKAYFARKIEEILKEK